MAFWSNWFKKKEKKSDNSSETKQNLPETIEEFNEYHYRVLRRLNKHRVNEKLSGLISVVVDIEKFIPVLQKLNLLEYAPYTQALNYLKIDELKNILKRNNLKVSGKKADLVQRIIENIGEAVTKEPEYTLFYQLTELGNSVLFESVEKIQKEQLDFQKRIYDLLLDKKIEKAYKEICMYNASSPVPNGMNCNWEEWAKEGISQSEKKIYNKYMNNSEDIYVTIGAIFSSISGEPSHRVADYLNNIYNKEIQVEDIKYICSCINTERDLIDFKECDIEKYSFLAALDIETCPVCGKLDGKKFKVEDAMIGVNCPPMHKGCRCTIISYIDEKSLKNMQRRARNPETGRSELIPYMNYNKWKKTYLMNNIKEQ